MAHPLAASLLDLLLSCLVGPAGGNAGNGVSLEGLTLAPGPDGARELRVARLEAASLRVECGPLVLEIGRLVLNELVARVFTGEGGPRVGGFRAAQAELSQAKLLGPLIPAPLRRRGPRAEPSARSAPAAAATAAGQSPASPWCLGPLATANGDIRAKIIDAHLLFDADVTVPIRYGQIDFNHATVEHVGPDSRMGVSRLGLYVDAPNGRSYLYQFPTAPLAGVEFERRGALLGPWVSDRGRLWLQPFSEGLVRQGPCGEHGSFTEQALLLFDRTALSGDVRLGDGRFTGRGLQADLAGREAGRNTVHLQSKAVGRGLTAEVPSLSLRDAVLDTGAMQLHCDGVEGALTIQLFVEGAERRFEFRIPGLTLSGLHLEQPREREDARERRLV